MLSKVFSCSVFALAGDVIEVEGDSSNTSQPHTVIVGLADLAVQESRERVRSAIRNSSLSYPRKKITINLAPADLKKEGPCFDLPIAISILICGEEIPAETVSDAMIIGELSLDGSVRHVRGILTAASKAKEIGLKKIFVPACDAAEASLLPGLEVYPVQTLSQLYLHLTGATAIQIQEPLQIKRIVPNVLTDFSEINGQEHVKRALEIAAAGSHNCLMIGPPGTGKTLMARALPSILPTMTIDEALDVTRIYSIADMLPPDMPLIQTRPFRSPHHTISHAGLVGGGNQPRPGEISLAHHGVLFLDELPEFGPQVLEVLRQPLEDKIVTISRAAGSVNFPANFMLIAAMNPCPCGYYGDPVHPCTCSEMAITKYQKRISGPLLDRIDIQIQVPRIEYNKMSSGQLAETSASIQKRVEAAREIQRQRFADNHAEVSCNSEMRPAEIRQYCRLDEQSSKMMQDVMERFSISARVYHRLLKLARTIADLDNKADIGPDHMAEAIQYRPRRLGE